MRAQSILAGTSQRSHGAFSLIEILCAVLLLGVALVGLTQGLTTALRSTKESELQTTAALFAAGVIETLRAEGGLESGVEEGECGPGLGAYTWTRTILPTDIEGLHNVSVTVSHSGTGKPVYTLDTLLFEVPLDSGSNARDKERSRGRGGAR